MGELIAPAGVEGVPKSYIYYRKGPPRERYLAVSQWPFGNSRCRKDFIYHIIVR